LRYRRFIAIEAKKAETKSADCDSHQKGGWLFFRFSTGAFARLMLNNSSRAGVAGEHVGFRYQSAVTLLGGFLLLRRVLFMALHQA
jgi:hypothetical protein